MSQTDHPLPAEFKPAYRYTMIGGKARNCEVLDADLWQKRCVVYARVHDGEVVYVGKCDGSLRGRIGAHVRGISSDLPIMNPMTREYRKWAEGKTITIFAHWPPPVSVCGYPVDVHAGLEAALIRALKPRFVKRI